VLADYMEQGKVVVNYKSPVTKVVMNHGRITSVLCGAGEYVAKEYIVATGSVSHPETGSTGDGLRWLTSLGHSVQEPTPTVVPLAIKEDWVHVLAGVSLEMMKVTFFVDEKKAFALKGKILFTHFGISGPLILNNAHKVADLLPAGMVTGALDIFPGLDQGALEKQLLTVFDEHKNKEFKNIVKEIMPEGVQKGIVMVLSEYIDMSTKVHSITKEERKVIARLLKALPFTVEGLMGFDRAVVADGGVPLEEIDMRTMRSKKISNLLVTGDMLHINRPSGGFSLQLCWSTGYVAGSQAGKR
jgi:predicted Rossmann fold flavoprotein